MTSTADRQDALHRFVETALSQAPSSIVAASADASFRSYWRVTTPDGVTRIAMDAPPGKEDIAPWLEIGMRLRNAGLHTPQVFASDAAQGFILMEDLGTRTYLAELNEATANELYGDALDALLRMQTHADPAGLPAFDEAFMTAELELMPQWFLRRHLGHEPDCDEWDIIEVAFRTLLSAARGQPQTFMHRDYHSRNLMIVARADQGAGASAITGPGIIDFQDAMSGPLTYDLVSLLRDCYIEWDAERVEDWMENHRQRLQHVHSIDVRVDATRFRRWFDLVGLQRHLKVLGVFCRLWYRDGKAHYLGNLPLVWRYVITIARSYRELAPLADALEHALGDRDITQPRAEAGMP